jgi:hypothetical protein
LVFQGWPPSRHKHESFALRFDWLIWQIRTVEPNAQNIISIWREPCSVSAVRAGFIDSRRHAMQGQLSTSRVKQRVRSARIARAGMRRMPVYNRKLHAERVANEQG